MGQSYIGFVGATFAYNVYRMIVKNIKRCQNKRALMKRRLYFRENKDIILHQERVDREYSKKIVVNKMGDLRAQFKAQEEKKMIRAMERSYLKA